MALAITHSSFDLFSMIGCIMLLGIASKNSILLVDFTNQLRQQGVPLLPRPVLERLERDFFARYAMIAYSTDIEVIRSTKF